MENIYFHWNMRVLLYMLHHAHYAIHFQRKNVYNRENSDFFCISFQVKLFLFVHTSIVSYNL